MKKYFFFLAALLTGLNGLAQTEDNFTKGDNNIEYKIFPSAAGGEKITYGSFLKMRVVQLYRGAKDSVLYDSDNFGTPIQPLDTVSLPNYYYAILNQLKNKDSLAMRIVIDSAYKNSPTPMPSAFERGKYLYTCVRILDVFSTKAQADSAMASEQKIMADKQKQIEEMAFAKETEFLQNYFASNGIKDVIKAPKGTFIKITKKGVGRNATIADKVKVNYTGKLFNGKVFDSNTDPNFQHVTPYDVTLNPNAPSVITGWMEGLLYFNKGAKGILYVPSPLGYGSRGNGPAIGPNEILVFDIEVLSVTPISAVAQKTVPPKAIKKPVVKAKPKAKSK
jgi:FKBP-type peptidyl-prolyl cis-trans isomerase FkpA